MLNLVCDGVLARWSPLYVREAVWPDPLHHHHQLNGWYHLCSLHPDDSPRCGSPDDGDADDGGGYGCSDGAGVEGCAIQRKAVSRVGNVRDAVAPHVVLGVSVVDAAATLECHYQPQFCTNIIQIELVTVSGREAIHKIYFK